jgi:hypothetical protein
VEVVRHRKKTSHVPVTDHQEPSTPMQEVSSAPVRPQLGHLRRSGITAARPPSITQLSSSVPGRKALGEKTARPLNKTTRQDSETSRMLRYIPQNLTPQMTATLLAEMSKPISPHDDEGYIYIFWLTPDAVGPAPSSTASTLLAPQSRPDQGRRTSDVLRQYSVKKPQRSRPDTARRRFGDANIAPINETIFLKIGRANNVHRRMNEWQRQCGYSVSLVRFYPYVPSTTSTTPSPQASPGTRRQSYQNTGRAFSDNARKLPHAHRVERLIHLELIEQRVIKDCDACGKTHKEWFEVEATKEGVKKVDEVVKRWVEWAERANE